MFLLSGLAQKVLEMAKSWLAHISSFSFKWRKVELSVRRVNQFFQTLPQIYSMPALKSRSFVLFASCNLC